MLQPQFNSRIWRLQKPNCPLFVLIFIVVVICTLYLPANINVSDERLTINICQPPMKYPNNTAGFTYESEDEADRCKGFITVSNRGRLGNKMAEYASLFANAKVYGFKPIIMMDLYLELSSIFPHLSIPAIDFLPKDIQDCFKQDNMWYPIHDNQLDLLPDHKADNVFMSGWPNDLKKVKNFVEEMQREFRFCEPIQKRSEQFLSDIRTLHMRKLSLAVENLDDIVPIGMHARRTDYNWHVWWVYNGVLVTEEYFKTAMKEFREKLREEGKVAVFIVSSDDLPWCVKHFSEFEDVYFVDQAKVDETWNEFERAVLDLAILSNCEHSIISYGTFGMWTGLLAGGKTIMAEGWSETRYELLPQLPRNWTLINDPCLDDKLNNVC